MVFLAGRKIRFLVGVLLLPVDTDFTWLQVFIKAAWGSRNILCASRALVRFLLPDLA